MKIITYLSKQWTLRWRDLIIASVQAAGVAFIGFIVDHISLLGIKYSIGQLLTAATIVFIQHLGRKLIEPHKLITMQEVEKKDLPKAEQIVEQANENGKVPIAVVNSIPDSVDDEGDNPPNNNDPTHPPKKP